MVCSFRSLLVLSVMLAMTAGAPAARPPAPPKPPPLPKPHFPKPPAMPKPHFPKMPAMPKPHFPKPPPIRMAPAHFPHSKVIHHPRPIVYRGPVHMRHLPNRFVHHPGRRMAFRTVHRYPVHRFPRRFVRRPYYYYGHRRYSYFYYPGRYRWRTNYYNRGYGLWRPRVIGGIVQSVQGLPGGGTLMVRVPRSRYGRFRYAGAGRGATTVRRFLLNPATLYEVMTIPPRGGTIADLHRGERVLILTHTHTANTAQKVSVVSRARRR